MFRKLSWYLLPVFFLLNMLNYLDRTNLAFASIQMSQDLNLTTEQYGIGSGLFFLGYSSFQVPSQLILRKVGAPQLLAIIVTIWGITAACMAAITDEESFYIVRLVLGFAEAGSFPAYWYYLTRFYPDKHITLPFSITDSAIMIAQVCSPISFILPVFLSWEALSSTSAFPAYCSTVQLSNGKIAYWIAAC